MDKKPVPSLLNGICSTLKNTVFEFNTLWLNEIFSEPLLCTDVLLAQ